jgi:anti-sigma regulatory factor (Ser/Thr protein kinase)
MTEFSGNEESVAAARAFVAHVIGHCHRETIAVARLLTSELATNAVVHAHSAFDVAASESGGTVHVEVTDGCSTWPEALAAMTTDLHGRGLLLLGELSAGWGVVDAPPGKTVWFDLRCEDNP